MKTRLSPILFVLLLATLVLSSWWWLRTGLAQKSVPLAPPPVSYDPLPGATTRVSIANDGSQANNASMEAFISADGSSVAFISRASNLVSGDTNDYDDVFVHDWQTGITERASVDSNGGQANNTSWDPSISADGRYVAFHSDATNLVTGDTNKFCQYRDFQAAIRHHPLPPTITPATPDPLPHNCTDVFVHDRQTRITERVSVASDGSQANGGSYYASISADGRYVAFYSNASNLVSGDTNAAGDIFVHDRQIGGIERVSIASDGSQANSGSTEAKISANGRFVVFNSPADNLVTGDTNGYWDIFVHDRQTGVTHRVSIASDGSQGDQGSYGPTLSADGRYVAFSSYAGNLVDGDTGDLMDVFVHDRQTGVTQRASLASDGSQSNHQSFDAYISANGRYVSFHSAADNLVKGDTNASTDTFVRDVWRGITQRVSLAGDGSQGNSSVFGESSVSAEGHLVAFYSQASNLVAGDTNDTLDVFVHVRREMFIFLLPVIQNQP